MIEKREYINPEYTIVYFDESDIITTSGGVNESALNSNQLNAYSKGGDVSFDLFN